LSHFFQKNDCGITHLKVNTYLLFLNKISCNTFCVFSKDSGCENFLFEEAMDLEKKLLAVDIKPTIF